MKKLILVRHAKSSWDDLSLGDHERGLNSRGKKDAPFMAQLLASRSIQPPVLVSSTAVRAQLTAGYFAKALGKTAEDIHSEPMIYEANTLQLLQVIASLDKSWGTVALFGHNPGFTMLANLFYGNEYLDNLPTCGIVEIVGAEVMSWDDFSPATAKVEAVHYPKQYK